MELPVLAVVAEELARAVGGTVVPLDTGEFPSSAIRIGEHCVLLIRAHRNALVVSLPVGASWQASDRDEWTAAQPAIVSALATYRPVVSMSDVIASLPRQWTVSFPATPVPEEAWLFRGARTVRLFQGEASATIAVWEGSTKHEREVATLGSLEGLSAWIEEKVALQARLADAATLQIAEDAARRAAIPPPDMAQVISALREGVSFQIGGGRTYPTYAMKDGQLVVIQFDEGTTEEVRCTEDDLRAAMAEAPGLFRELLERWNARST